MVEPRGIVTEAGTVRLGEFELRLIVPPPVPLRVTIQAPDESGAIVAAVQVMPEIVSELASSEIAAVWEEPFNVAVTVTV